ncbi:MAG: peptide chain release factor N(5)-glutamine methyltransferase [Alcanivorax sp.]|uniref:Release factor glutamine methyltransferase n=1 Tax=Alloalcanivorax marinus TaxID=1177169 RepID=A0A9Q3YLY9_9GAMM|nr:peptide chain release factor N(5)-glutamine methyltransferase [Alloalcanivorax marinus]MBM7332456.1 peptide chain release factor N(5)-glutamine methyltransferase [Alloalcanivorax marinus]MCC4308249.1 peptide chain release factor N(5)-glutamine methyltransferase [Alloalcanivorax marinus]
MRIDEALRGARDTLAASPSARLDAELLLTRVLGQDRRYFYTWPEKTLTADQQRLFDLLVTRRAAGEPVAHLTGEREFYGRRFVVTPATLIPRPDTETLVEAALEAVPDTPRRVVDLGTGTGAVGVTLALERPAWRVILTDASAAALAVARDNAEALGAAVSLVRGDWLGALTGPFDLIVSNPPYVDPDDHHLEQGDVRFEPRSALAAHDRGLADLRVIAAQARERLAAGGWLMLEHGHDQGGAVRRLLAGHGFHDVTTRQDLGGNDRVTLGHV